MFQFPAFAPLRLYIQRRVSGLPQNGFPIQKSPDQSLFAGFPKLIAGCRVFLRLLMPRHPPYTLSNLTPFIDYRAEPPSLTGLRQFFQKFAPRACG
jgi:hypothetical protein